ncbi:hypothetical protein HC931_02730 [Candidatus Gracilibacteria bacterium]|nr:hypothetical protein [Candidatus Gracilibacteria bacterium]
MLIYAKKSLKFFLNPYTIPYIVLIVYYLIAFLAEHGPASFLFAYKTLRMFPFYLLGLLITQETYYLKLMLVFVFVGYALGAINRLPFFLAGDNRQDIILNSGLEYQDLEQSSGLVSVDTGLSEGTKLILYFFNKPYLYGLSLIIIATICLIFIIKLKPIKILLISTLVPSSLLIVRGQMTSAIMALIIGLFILAYFVQAKFLSAIYKKPQYGIPIVLLILCLIFLIIVEQISVNFSDVTTGEGWSKIQTLINYFFDDPLDAINRASNKRLDLMAISWETFLEEPFLGSGAVWGSALWRKEVAIGAHSTFIDQLAQFGLVGTIPLVYLFSQWLYQAWKIPQYEEFSIYRIGLLSIWIVYIIGCLMDPLFGTSLDQHVLLLAGMTCGLKSLAKRTIRRQNFNSYQFPYGLVFREVQKGAIYLKRA